MSINGVLAGLPVDPNASVNPSTGRAVFEIAAGSGGGTQYAEGTVQLTAIGALLLAKDPSSALRGLLVDAGGNLLINQRLSTAADQVTIAGGNVNALANLQDGFGQPIKAVLITNGIAQLQVNTTETVQIATWSALAMTTTAANYGPFNARNFKELVIAINAATFVGTSITFTYHVQDAQGNFIVAWSETLPNTATGNTYICVGPGYTAGTGRNISLGNAGRLQVVTTAGNVTLTGTAWVRT